MAATTFDLSQLPPALADAIRNAPPASELVIVDQNVPVARLIVGPPQGARIAGLHLGSFVVADDFDAPLPDDFWLGEQ
jgi:antitoxin (DNA-binding transcriptional repressor) of toxin-antitoxin stability system